MGFRGGLFRSHHRRSRPRSDGEAQPAVEGSDAEPRTRRLVIGHPDHRNRAGPSSAPIPGRPSGNATRRVCARVAVSRSPHDQDCCSTGHRVRGTHPSAGGRDLSLSNAHVDSTRRAAIATEHPQRWRYHLTHRCCDFERLLAPRCRRAARAGDRHRGHPPARSAPPADAGSLSEAAAAGIRPGDDEFPSCAGWTAGLARIDRDAGICQRRRLAPAVCGVLADHLPRQRTHPPDVAPSHRAARSRLSPSAGSSTGRRASRGGRERSSPRARYRAAPPPARRA